MKSAKQNTIRQSIDRHRITLIESKNDSRLFTSTKQSTRHADDGYKKNRLSEVSRFVGAGIAQWLEHRTRDWKVAGSNPCWNGGRIFFSRVDFLCWLLFRYPFHPRVTTVARKKSRSFCQKCRWQVTAKHAYTLRTEPCFGIGHNLSLICQMTSEDIKHQLKSQRYRPTD